MADANTKVSIDEYRFPPRPLSPDVHAARSGDEMTLVYKDPGGALGGVLLSFWLFIYFVVSYQVFIVQAETYHGSLGQAFGILIWGSLGLGVVALMLMGFVGKEHVRLGPNGLLYERRAVIRYRRRFIPLQETSAVRAATVRVMRDGDPYDHRVLQFDSSAGPLNFALGLEEREQTWLVAVVGNHLETLR